MSAVSTAVGTPDAFRMDLMGWYYRSSMQMYEFWWMGTEPKISLAAEMLDVMPTEIVMEIRASSMVKLDLDVLS